MEIRIRLPREDLMALAKLATSRNQAASVTASEIVRNYIVSEQNAHPTIFSGSVAVAFLVGIIVGVLAMRFGGG